MDIASIVLHKEAIAENVHNSWWDEKKKQGFHAPIDCESASSKMAREQDEKSLGHNEFCKFHKFCDKCHTDMYPYSELPENIKDYDRVTVDAVLSAIDEI